MTVDIERLVEHRDASLSEVRLHYVEAGEGPLVLMMHGFPQCWYAWRKQIPALVDAGYRVIAPDLRGYNLSDKPPRVSDYSRPKLVNDMYELIHHAGETKAFVVAHDWGGTIAWDLAAHHPEAVEKLVAINGPSNSHYVRLLRNPRQLAKAWYILVFQIPWLPQRLITNPRVQRHLGWTARSWMTDGDLLYYRTALEQPGAAKAMVSYYRAAARRVGSRFGKQQVRCPVLVLWGEHDMAMIPEQADIPPDIASDVITKRFPASHWLPEHKPELVNEAVLEFLTLPTNQNDRRVT